MICVNCIEVPGELHVNSGELWMDRHPLIGESAVHGVLWLDREQF